jgi:Domain of unknown function (DUF4148)
MKNVTRILSVSAIAMGLLSGAAYAEPGKTRAQVQAELVAAEKAGDITFGQGGNTLHEIWPQRYAIAKTADAGFAPADQTASAKAARADRVESLAPWSVDSTLPD